MKVVVKNKLIKREKGGKQYGILKSKEIEKA